MEVSNTRKLSIKLWSTLATLLFFMCSAIPSRAQTPEQPTSPTDAQVQARDALNHGVEAFKNGRVDEAIRFFIRAKELDPSFLNARLYLATSYASEYIPGAPSEENQRMGQLAADEYKEVFEMDPQNLSAIDGLASILYQRAGQPFDPEMYAESKSYHQKHIELRPKDPQPYYAVGVIDWALSYHANSRLRQSFNASVGGEGLKDSDPLPETLRTEYVQQFGTIVDEGIDKLKRAIALKPDYDDAMVYLNLLYRRKADMAATPAEREQYTSLADELLDRVKEIKGKNMQSAQ